MIVALPLLSSTCHEAVIVLCLFLIVPYVGLQCVIVSFPGHTHLLLIRLYTGCLQEFQFKIKQR